MYIIYDSILEPRWTCSCIGIQHECKLYFAIYNSINVIQCDTMYYDTMYIRSKVSQFWRFSIWNLNLIQSLEWNHAQPSKTTLETAWKVHIFCAEAGNGGYGTGAYTPTLNLPANQLLKGKNVGAGAGVSRYSWIGHVQSPQFLRTSDRDSGNLVEKNISLN